VRVPGDYRDPRAPRVPESTTIRPTAALAAAAIPQETRMRAALSAALPYFAIVFAIGFALGTLRVTTLEPRLGELAAVAVELPAMLGASWLASAWLVRGFRVPRTTVARLAMGGLALALLLGAEWALGLLLFGRDAGAQIAAWTSPPGLLGLAAQLAFGLVPFVQAQRVLRR
jgi:hypothetical protein